MSKDDQKSRYLFLTHSSFLMNNVKYATGLDMAKDKFHVCISVINSAQKVTVKASSHFANSLTGFGLLLKWVKKHCKENLPVVYVMEATDLKCTI